MVSKPIAMQLVKRKVDGYGNVPRLLLVYSEIGHVAEIVTIDYGNIPGAYEGVVRLPDMELTIRDFNEWRSLQRKG